MAARVAARWRTGRLWWSLIVIAVIGVLAVILATSPINAGARFLAPETATLIGLTAMAVFVIFFLGWGSRALGVLGSPRRVNLRLEWVILAGLYSLGGLLVFLNANMLAIQILAYPLLWAVSSHTVTAIRRGAIFALTLWVCVMLGVQEPGWVLSGTLGLIAGFIANIAMGLWVSRIADYGQERARLLAELTARQEEIAVLHRETGALSERARLGRDLHDTIAQTLTGVGMLARGASRSLEQGDSAAAAATLELITAATEEALVDTRTLVATMTTENAPSLGATLERLTQRFAAETSIRVDLDNRIPEAVLDRGREVIVVRCVQEGLANVRKHAQAHAVIVSCTVSGELVTVLLRDDGVGVASLEGAPMRFGLSGMRERLEPLGGTVSLTSEPGSGARLHVIFPLHRDPEGAQAS